MRRTPAALLAGGLVLAAITGSAAWAQAPAARANAIDEASLVGPPAGRPLTGEELARATLALGSRMRCPVCQGMSIADSPSASAVAMLSQTRNLLERGYTEEQVLDYFERSYGEFVLLQPTARGFNLVVWLAPALAILAGAGLIARRLRATRGAAGPAAPAADPTAEADPDLDPYLERVRSESGR